MLATLAAAAPVAGSTSARAADTLWLVVGASNRSPAAIARAARTLAPQFPAGFVVNVGDCGRAGDVYAWVAAASADAADAAAALARLRTAVKDAYTKRCDVKPQSLLAYRISAVHESIADVPADAVNWSDADRVSSIQALADGRAILIERRYVPTADDPLEGRRTSVLLVDAAGRRTTLRESCVDPGTVILRGRRLAFDCATEQAGDHLLHTVVVFDAGGALLAQVEHCRVPVWSAAGSLSCRAESVDGAGRLRLQEQDVAINAAPRAAAAPEAP